MIREEVKRLLPEINHWANGGVLYWYDSDDKTWRVIKNWSLDCLIDVPIVIEDKHLEARKAFALGEEIECKNKLVSCIGQIPEQYGTWHTPAIGDMWKDTAKYRPKPKEPIYEWQWIHKLSDEYGYKMTKEWMTETTVNPTWIKFEPSKRLKK